jgi:hypothetical protein
MKERTSLLAGLRIGAAISNTSHSNKAGSTTVKRARFKVNDQGRRQCCHDKLKKFPYRPTCDVSLPSGHDFYLGHILVTKNKMAQLEEAKEKNGIYIYTISLILHRAA